MRTAIICGAIFLVITAVPVAANDATPASAATTPETSGRHLADSADHVRIVAVDHSSGEQNRAMVEVMIDPGYHINANPASLDYLIPTTLNITSPSPLRVIYPQPVSFKPEFADQALDVYQGTIRIAAEFREGALAKGPLRGALTVQACTDKICLPPADLAVPQE